MLDRAAQCAARKQYAGEIVRGIATSRCSVALSHGETANVVRGGRARIARISRYTIASRRSIRRRTQLFLSRSTGARSKASSPRSGREA